MQSAYTLCEIQQPGQGGPRARHDSADWSEDDLLAEGFAANLATFRALQQRGRLTLAEVAESLCVSARTVRRWLKTGKPDPMAVRLLAILAGYVPWAGWDGWEVHQGLLFPPGYRCGGIPPGEFFALVFYRQQVAAYQEANAKLKAQVAALASGSPAELQAQVDQLQAELSAFRSLAGQFCELSARGERGGMAADA